MGNGLLGGDINREVVAEYRSVVAEDEASSERRDAADPAAPPDAASMPRGWTIPDMSAVETAPPTAVAMDDPLVMKSNGGGTVPVAIPLSVT